MRVYRPFVGEGYELVNPAENENVEVLQQLDGASRARGWTPFRVRLVREDEGRALQRSDAPSFALSSVLVLRPAAVLAMGPMLRAHGELLPLDCPDDRLVVFNATQVLDALDEPRSTFERAPSDGRIIWVDKYVFRPQAIGTRTMFRIASLASPSDIFVTQELVDAWKAAGLRGLDFQLLWEG